MAEQRPADTRGSGHSSRGGRSLPAVAAVSAGASGSTTSARQSFRPRAATEPAFPSRDTATRATYRHLLMRGLEPGEASNLTAFLCGIHVGDQHWQLTEVNRLLFLRELARAGSWGAEDGAARTTH